MKDQSNVVMLKRSSLLHVSVNSLYIMLLHVAVYHTVCDFYCMWLFCAFLSAASLPNKAHCEELELHCFLGKMPQASVQEMRGVGACRLKYLQWRHAMASFIRCLTSWTIKLSSMFFMTLLYSLFSPKRDYVSIWNCSYSLIWGTLCGLNWKPHIHLTPYENISYKQGALL